MKLYQLVENTNVPIDKQSIGFEEVKKILETKCSIFFNYYKDYNMLVRGDNESSGFKIYDTSNSVRTSKSTYDFYNIWLNDYAEETGEIIANRKKSIICTPNFQTADSYGDGTSVIFPFDDECTISYVKNSDIWQTDVGNGSVYKITELLGAFALWVPDLILSANEIKKSNINDKLKPVVNKISSFSNIDKFSKQNAHVYLERYLQINNDLKKLQHEFLISFNIHDPEFRFVRNIIQILAREQSLFDGDLEHYISLFKRNLAKCIFTCSPAEFKFGSAGEVWIEGKVLVISKSALLQLFAHQKNDNPEFHKKVINQILAQKDFFEKLTIDKETLQLYYGDAELPMSKSNLIDDIFEHVKNKDFNKDILLCVFNSKVNLSEMVYTLSVPLQQVLQVLSSKFDKDTLYKFNELHRKSSYAKLKIAQVFKDKDVILEMVKAFGQNGPSSLISAEVILESVDDVLQTYDDFESLVKTAFTYCDETEAIYICSSFCSSKSLKFDEEFVNKLLNSTNKSSSVQKMFDQNKWMIK